MIDSNLNNLDPQTFVFWTPPADSVVHVGPEQVPVPLPQLPLPVNVIGEERLTPSMAPTVGQHTDEVMADVLGLDESRIAELRDGGAFG